MLRTSRLNLPAVLRSGGHSVPRTSTLPTKYQADLGEMNLDHLDSSPRSEAGSFVGGIAEAAVEPAGVLGDDVLARAGAPVGGFSRSPPPRPAEQSLLPDGLLPAGSLSHRSRDCQGVA